jgi:hypothetical protein
MKKLLMVLVTSGVLLACGGRSDETSEADRDEDIESTEPDVSAPEDMRDDGSPPTDTAGTISSDTTNAADMSAEDSPSR